MITNSTQRELNNTLKTSLYQTTKLLALTDFICLNMIESHQQYYFKILYRGYNSYSGYTYVVQPTFNFVHKYF